jgi:ABC-type lipopolysaccharide export system ATPase subunit
MRVRQGEIVGLLGPNGAGKVISDTMWAMQLCEFQLLACEREWSNDRACFRCCSSQSTTFNIMVGREPPSGGSVFLGPLDITTLSLPHRARLGIGYLTQVPSLSNSMNGFRVKSPR